MNQQLERTLKMTSVSIPNLKTVAIGLAALFALTAKAEILENRTALSQSQTQADVYMNSTEAGFGLSSVNSGTTLAQISYWHEFNPGIAVGLRAGLPLNFSSETQVFVGQAAARFFLVNTANMLFLDAHLTAGIQNQKDLGTSYFPGLGLDYGYKREINRSVALGGSLGLDYLNHNRGSDASADSGSQWNLFSQLSLFGAFYF